MLGKRQFSLGYMLLETFWIASALGITRWCYLTLTSASDEPAILFPVGIVLWATAIGGLFGRMNVGAMLGVLAIVALIIANFMGH